MTLLIFGIVIFSILHGCDCTCNKKDDSLKAYITGQVVNQIHRDVVIREEDGEEKIYTPEATYLEIKDNLTHLNIWIHVKNHLKDLPKGKQITFLLSYDDLYRLLDVDGFLIDNNDKSENVHSIIEKNYTAQHPAIKIKKK